MAISDRILGYLGSKKNLAGASAGLGGLVLTFTGAAGAYWPAVVAGLYGAGALLAPPERVAPPAFPDPATQLGELREDFTALRSYAAATALPPEAAGRMRELTAVLDGLLDPRWSAEALPRHPEALHALARIVRRDLPESIDAYARARWWSRLAPGAEAPESHLDRQLTLLLRDATRLAADLREEESGRQRSHSRYLEDRPGD
ncbi:hypothetical protein O7599_13080 [Streptomyces sp. WMMC500]|uniref:hypothetical protein n=1 Tax=Streptomyces sp. WMMC500 TaxID=3015154 RepID=UPI00248C864F|nr:hypothetical protein [Streptomyces sp. WMMC500]WBB63393.1 hypothetical protein O7599_13080 [Streptomyces sp. WMMC500]